MVIRTSLLFSCLISLTGAWLSIASLSGAEEYPGQPAADWDALFTRAEGWTGGDVSAAFPLPGGRTVWVFGDSWIGRVG